MGPETGRPTRMRVGIAVMPIDGWSATLRRAQEIEALGFDQYWLYDHLSWRHYRDRPWHSTVAWLAGVAAGTSTIEIGTMVASPNLRHPLTLAKDAMSLDHMSDGRFVLGVGAGATGYDATVFGDPPLSAGDRAARFVEYATVVDALLRGETDHDGQWYTVSGGRVLPGCVQQPRVPMALAAGGRRTVEFAARFADAWITLGDPTTPAPTLDAWLRQLAEQAAIADTACVRSGRQPDELGRTVFLSASRREPMESLGAFRSFVRDLEGLGFDSVVIHDRVADDPALAFDKGLLGEIAAWRVSGAD